MLRITAALRRRQKAHQRQLDEANALLEGTFLEHQSKRCLAAPSWAALNPAAHGSLAALQRVAGERRGAAAGVAEPAGVAEAAREIASEVAKLVGEDEDFLALLQTLMLIPLELRLMRSTRPEQQALGYVVASARSALRSARC